MIIQIGEQVHDFKPGQKIVFKGLIKSEEDGEKFGYIHEDDVLGLIFSEN
jgi:co-chaperonin GroES (HSP10)